jgi:hypothetical protein
MSNSQKWQVTFRYQLNGNEVVRQAKGRVAQTLSALVLAGDNGVTAAEMSCWAYRLGAYVHLLRHDYSLDIITKREEHEGGWHGRYVLLTAVEIIELDKPDRN